MAYSAIALTRRHTAGSDSGSCAADQGGAASRATTTDAITMTAAYTPGKHARDNGFRHQHQGPIRDGHERGADQSAAVLIGHRQRSRIINTGTPKMATPIAAFSGGSLPMP